MVFQGLSLIFGTHKYAQSKVGIVTFDTMITEEHKYNARVTNYPVEDGTIVSDHILKLPDVIVLSGLVTDTPLNIFASFNRSILAFQQLVNIFENRQIVQVTTGIKVYQNMAITSLDVPRNIRTGQTLTFNITLQQINFDDTIQVLAESDNVFSGVQDNTPASIVKDNTTTPLFKNDPPLSFQDQASSGQNVGVQSLTPVPTATLPNILETLPAIVG